MISTLEPGQTVKLTALVSYKDSRVTAAGKPYLSLRLCDTTGLIPAVVWTNAKMLDRMTERGMVVEVTGKVGEYNGDRQLEVNSCAPTGESPQDFLPRSPQDCGDMTDDLDEWIDSIKDEGLHDVLQRTIGFGGKYRNDFLVAPAAVLHHQNYLHGLLEHTLQVAQLAVDLADTYGADHHLVLTAALLHDISKVLEYRYDDCLDRTETGKLLGNTAFSGIVLAPFLNKLPSEQRDALLHCVLAHHGKLEWGSPVEPQTLEAHIVHLADLVDCRLVGFNQKKGIA
jgi:3'-5' exoribonuclease